MHVKADIVIYGAGIAGLWILARLKRAGYNVLLLEKEAVGGVQTIAAQGIIHSGLKFALAGKVSALARSISAMPGRWRDCFEGHGELDLRAAKISARSQYLMIPEGFSGALTKIAAKKVLSNTFELSRADWPGEMLYSGFKGSMVSMGEPVVDVPSLIRALAEPYRDSIRTLVPGLKVSAQKTIYTTAGHNVEIAKTLGHAWGMDTQARPLLMGLMRGAPFPLFAHLVGMGEKPIATITTHKDKSGALVWYLGGLVAERKLDADPKEVYDAARTAFAEYMPDLDLRNVEWATYPVNRIEGRSRATGWMPDTPTIHRSEDGHTLYCWPTKMTFAPMLADMVIKDLGQEWVTPSQKMQADYSALPAVKYAAAPWDKAKWTKDI